MTSRTVRAALACTLAGLLATAIAGSPADALTKKKPVKTKKAATTKATAPVTTAPATSVAPATTLAPTATTPAAAPAPKITWASCGSGVDCGQLTAPLDYKNPGNGQTVQLGVARRPARRAANRIGILVVNPGGPAGSAFDMVSAASLTEDMPAAILDRFDIIGIDPRGVTRSVPVLCAIAPSTTGDRTDKSRAYSQSCGTRSGNVLPFVGTDSSAQDIETLRVALGEQQISYLGFSYGTFLGGLYAQAHPDQVRAMILDGAEDPTRFGVAHVQDQLKAKERALNEFFTACAAAGKNCGLAATGKTPKQRYEEMLLIASQTGIGAEKINRDDLESLTGTLLGESWGALNKALGDLSAGGTASAIAILDYFGGDPNNRFEDGSFEAISCRDGEFPSSRPEEMTPPQRLTTFQAAAPHFLAFADFWANDAMCVGWPVPPNPKAALSTTAGSKIVVVGNTLDVRTPIEWAQGLSSQLGARMVTFDDYVHTATLSGEKCITSMMTSWLVDLSAPSSGLVC